MPQRSNPFTRWWRGPEPTQITRIEPKFAERPPLRIPFDAVARVQALAPQKTNPFVLPRYAPGVVPEDVTLAMDDAWGAGRQSLYGGFAGADYGGLWAEGIGFAGYPALAELTQRAEYRRPSEVIAEEKTRKWLMLKATGNDKGKQKKIAALNAAMDRFRVRHNFREALELEGFMGLAQIAIDLGNNDDDDEQKTRLILSRAKIGKGQLKGFRVIDPIWVAPNLYNTTDPRDPAFYKPQTWFLMGKQVHTTRLITLVSRPVPDILKPAYNFGGVSLSQMLKPYVDNWLRTRQSVSDLIQAFTVFVLETNLEALLQGGPDDITRRAQLFTEMRTNLGLMLTDKNTEGFQNVSAPLGGLDHLQAQAQEHMAAVSGEPLVKAFGITPSGLNSSSDGEIRVFYDYIHARQERVLDDPIKYVLSILQLNEFGEIDPSITHEWLPLWELDAAGQAAVRKTDADTAAVYIDAGVVAPDEVRAALAADETSPYAGLEGEAPGAPETSEPMNLSDPAERIDSAAENGSESGANSGA